MIYWLFLKGMLGMLFNYVLKIVFIIIGILGLEIEIDGNEDMNVMKVFIKEFFLLYNYVVLNMYEKVLKQIDKLFENDVLEGCKYIEEDSLKIFILNDNLKIYFDGSILFDVIIDESCLLVWKW